MELEAGKRSDRFWVSATLSLVAHGVLFFLLAVSPPGLPTGVEAARVYSLTYLGSLPAGQAAPSRPATVVATEPQGGPPPAPPVKAVVKAVPKPAAKPQPKPSAVPKPAAAPKAPGNVLASPRGTEELPLPAKPAPVKPRPADPAPQEKPSAPEPPVKPALEPTPATPEPSGTPGTGDAESTGPPAPPPRGVAMVARLPKLVYPKNAQNSRAKGTVLLKAEVGVDGGRIKVEVERHSGDAGLDEYARHTIELGLVANPWTKPYVVRLKVRFERGKPEVTIIDEPVEVGG